MQFAVPRIILVLLSVALAVFCYCESLYYSSSAVTLGEGASGLRAWMWAFRLIAMSSLGFAVVVIAGLVRKILW